MTPTRPPEDENERLVVNWLGIIAVASMVGVVVLALGAGKTVGIDTAVIVALIGITASATSSLGTRRTRGVPAPPAPVDGPPPPEPPPLPAYLRGEGELRFAPAPPPGLDDDDTLGH